MRIPLVAAFAALLCVSAAAVAQETVTGTYNGNIEVNTNRGPTRWGVTMVISSVEDGKVKGTGIFQQGPCRGDYPIVGSIKDGVIGVISQKGGTASDCVFGFKGKIDGNRLVGNMGKYELEFRK